ncbi:hypothetical protein SKTS_21810 [Sulfurimicrobium lacus]|uniref:Zona occludens toxin N-terminal domain-containing protein n=1 Tax=Sulfurimicrobium lacus TaxID=2715678 RepID=A0A6F8VEV8_9PROT|nr:zonular occludens toxin domain-containing protein [Sulfurimicrobium lacus]BCB27295.1 hypothetical protein SKTS_21810 [Sulfurimicrobium lacus]
MIELHTGGNGAGKTCEIVSRLMAIKDRPIFVFGINELLIPHEKTPPISEWTTLQPHPEDASLLVPTFTFPPNALIVIDEAQNVYRPRGTGTKVPDIVAAFEAHRSLGIDFWLITQHPGLIDSNVRKLVRRHVHYRPTALGRYCYEWPEAQDPEKRSTAIKRKYGLDKKAFAMYKSADVHTKLVHKKPLAFYILGVVVVLAAVLGYRVYSRASEHLAPSAKPADAALSAQPSGHGGVGRQSTDKPVALVDYVSPVAGKPEFAPAYDELRKPKYMPVVSGCVLSRKGCRCYTQQGSKVDDVSADQCKVFVAGGSFNPYDSAVLVAAGQPGQVKIDAPSKTVDIAPSEIPPHSALPHRLNDQG